MVVLRGHIGRQIIRGTGKLEQARKRRLVVIAVRRAFGAQQNLGLRPFGQQDRLDRSKNAVLKNHLD
jgi:hypothetical protein